jgi:integrase
MSSVKLSFFVKSKSNKKKQSPIVMTIIYDKLRTQIYTGVWIDRKLWDNRRKIIKGNDEYVVSINDTLKSLEVKARKVCNELVLSGKPFNSITIKEKIKNGFNKQIKVIEGFDIFLSKMKDLIGKKYTRTTLQKYANTKERVKEFIKYYTQRSDIFLYELDSLFMEEFDSWLRTKYLNNNNSVYKQWSRFSRYIRKQLIIGNIEKYPFSDYQIKMEYKQGHYLSYEEIMLIENNKIELPTLEQTRLLFLFCCYTGLAFIDMYNLTIENLIKDEEGIIWVKSTRQKSRSRISIPLISNAISILHELRSGKYPIRDNKLLPIKANIHLNLEIKRVCALSGINDFEMVSWHSSRRSLSSIMMKANLPILVLQKILSHKSLHTSIQWYSHTDDAMVSKSMLELDNKLKLISHNRKATE